MGIHRGKTVTAVTALVAGVLTATALAGCSSSGADSGSGGSVEDPSGLLPSPTATKSFPSPTPVADGTTVDAGGWGIVKQHNSTTGDTVFALRVTGVKKGKPGVFTGVQDLGGGSLTSDDAVAWWIDYDYVVLSGDGTWSPNHLVSAAPADESDQDDLSTLSVPADLVHCRQSRTETAFGEVGLVQHGCLTAAATDGVAPAAVAFSSLPPGTRDVRWALPRR
jgi:hypothetical protein